MAVEEAVEDFADAFDEAREELFPEGSVCRMLEQDGDLQNYTVSAVVASGWLPLDERGRDVPELLIATMDETFADLVPFFTHYAVNTNVFRIHSGETIPPQGTEPYWRFFGGNTHETFDL